VTDKLKTSNHPNQDGYAYGYVINGVEGMELTLVRGQTYTFKVLCMAPSIFNSKLPFLFMKLTSFSLFLNVQLPAATLFTLAPHRWEMAKVCIMKELLDSLRASDKC
jgi:hypothetical protein